jgi:demethylspheroidene O-methyltransferase
MPENLIKAFLERTRAFAPARAALAALELGLFPALAERPKGAEELRRELGLADSAITDSFFDLLVTAGFLERSGKALSLAPLGRSILGSYEAIRSWGREMLLTYRSLSDLEQLLRTGASEQTEMAKLWAYKGADDPRSLDPEALDAYSRLMDASQEELAPRIASAYDFSKHRHAIEFGGGYGRLGMTLARLHPGLRVTIADLPNLCEETERRISEAGLLERVGCLPCDFLKDPLPQRVADLVLFCRVLHDWSDEQLTDLLARTRGCLEPEGVVLAVEPMVDESQPIPESSVPSALMLALLGGRRRSVQAYERVLRSIGYRQVDWKDIGQSIWKMIIARL